DLLHLRREDAVLSRQDRRSIDGAVLGPQALVLRYLTDSDEDRLLVVNLGEDLRFIPAPEPLLAPVAGGSWMLHWSSEHPQYGGPGIVNPLSEQGWVVPSATATLFLAAKPETSQP